MKKLQTLVAALLAVSMLGAILVASASAAVWQRNGVTIAANKASETAGEITLEDTKTPAGAAAVLCSGILVGTVGAAGKDEITEVLNLAKEKQGAALEGLALLCSAVKACAAATEASPIEVWAEKLPWPTQLVLVGTEFRDEVTGAAYDLLCLVLGIMVEDLCEGNTSFKLENQVGGVAAPEKTAGTRVTCTLGGAESGVNETDALTPITLVEGGELTAAE